MKKIFLQSCVFAFLFIACNDGKSKILYKEGSRTAHLEKNQRVLTNTGNLMNLPYLLNGRNGLYARIWIWGFPVCYVVNVSLDSLDYNCSILEFDTEGEDSLNTHINIRRSWKGLHPKSGWDSFEEKLNVYKIPFLENGNAREKIGYSLTSGSYIQFEIAETNRYRFYEYFEPSYYRFVDSNSNLIYSFLEYLNTEMGVNVYNPDKQSFRPPN